MINNVYQLNMSKYITINSRKVLNIKNWQEINFIYTEAQPMGESHTLYIPGLVSGLINSDGSFVVRLKKSNKYNTGYQVILVFSFEQKIKDKQDKELFSMLSTYFKCGKVYYNNNSVGQFQVYSTRDLVKYIIPHFDKYPMLGEKQWDYLLFKKVIDLIQDKKHLSKSGLKEIIQYTLNMHLSVKKSKNKLETIYKYLILSELRRDPLEDEIITQEKKFITIGTNICNLVDRDKNIEYLNLINFEKINNNKWGCCPPCTPSQRVAGESGGQQHKAQSYIKGYIIGLWLGDGCFGIKLGKYPSVYAQLTQHKYSIYILEFVKSYLNCGKIIKHPNKSWVDLRITTLKDTEILLSFLKKELIIGRSTTAFNIYKETFYKIKRKEHLTEKGHKEIINLGYEINSKGKLRKYTKENI